MTPEHVKCLIIGSGPAGYTAAIYAARANMQPVLYQGAQPGGQLTITTEVDNFPGYPQGVNGPQMMQDLEAQARRFGSDVRYGVVTSVQFEANPGPGRPHRAVVDEKHEITADSIIISTGASAKWLGLPSEMRLNGRGVSACAVCDGFFFRNQDVAIVGAGDTAAEEASYLSNICRKVYMLVRRDQMRASRFMQQRVLSKDNIEVLWNTETLEVLGDEEVNGILIQDTVTGEQRTLDVTGFFVAIGHKPNTDIFKNYLDMDSNGYILTEKGSTRTNIPGVFACGDAQDNVYRQAITAAGTGCMAALDAERYLVTLEMQEHLVA
ncbi:thioredoxin-disulfide reductase [Rudanella lutea]|uniref:thioredoxin-disulfide reductase n=1 Tax=Rudanella lutea TaxID=451374 RepID=UPI00035D60A1|nr:thioredoxin-disulfide reductase [Rudanella lutea]